MAESLTTPINNKDTTDLTSLLNSIPGVIYRCELINGEWVIRYINEACRELFGFPPDEFLGKSIDCFSKIIHPVDRRQCLERRTGDAFEYRIVKASGKIIWVREKGRMVNDGMGNVLWLDGAIFDIQDRKDAEESLASAMRILESQATTDGLTGIANRRFFDRTLRKEWKRHQRTRNCLGVAIIDVDCFKRYNDVAGHPAGDDCLHSVAQTIEMQIRRGGDLAARLGGEEFGVILPETDEPGVLKVGENIRDAIESLHISHACSTVADHLTVSVGCAVTIPTAQSRSRELVEIADEALYQAKTEGRNRVVLRSLAALAE